MGHADIPEHNLGLEWASPATGSRALGSGVGDGEEVTTGVEAPPSPASEEDQPRWQKVMPWRYGGCR